MTIPTRWQRCHGVSVRLWSASTWTRWQRPSGTRDAAGNPPGGSRAAGGPPRLPTEPEGRMQMFERFTDQARRVVVLAQEEARRLDHDYIGTEHVLLGLIREGEGVAARVLRDLGAQLTAVRERVLELMRESPPESSPPSPPLHRAGTLVQLGEILQRLDALANRMEDVVDRLNAIERHIRRDEDSGSQDEPGTGSEEEPGTGTN